jgi:hypothetical protein
VRETNTPKGVGSTDKGILKPTIDENIQLRTRHSPGDRGLTLSRLRWSNIDESYLHFAPSNLPFWIDPGGHSHETQSPTVLGLRLVLSGVGPTAPGTS